MLATPPVVDRALMSPPAAHRSVRLSRDVGVGRAVVAVARVVPSGFRSLSFLCLSCDLMLSGWLPDVFYVISVVLSGNG